MWQADRLFHSNWDLYDTRHVVYRPARLSADQLEAGYWWAYREFYRWSSIWRGAMSKPGLVEAARHMAYARGWKKLEPLWDLTILAKRISKLRPTLEAVLTGFGRHATGDSGTLGERETGLNIPEVTSA
jgi:hypothetical protein